MQTLVKPQINILETGKEYKILRVTGAKGCQMPPHISTKEAIIIVYEGEALLKLGNKEIHLVVNEPFIIPALASHSLFITEDFAAHVIMSADSEIKFINN
ncbi:MAG: cupin [Saprospiraceae bacterium]